MVTAVETGLERELAIIVGSNPRSGGSHSATSSSPRASAGTSLFSLFDGSWR